MTIRLNNIFWQVDFSEVGNFSQHLLKSNAKTPNEIGRVCKFKRKCSHKAIRKSFVRVFIALVVADDRDDDVRHLQK
jgi:hypothetical protein